MDRVGDEGDGFAREGEVGAVGVGEGFGGESGRKVPFDAVAEIVCGDLDVELMSIAYSEGLMTVTVK